MQKIEALFQNHRYVRLVAALLLALCFVALMPPVQISYTSFYLARGRYIKLGICLVLYGGYLIECLKTRRISAFFLSYLVYALSILISSLLMQNSLLDALWTYGLAPGGMVLLNRFGMRFFSKEARKAIFLTTLAYGGIYLVLAKLGYGNDDTTLSYYVLARASFMQYMLVCLVCAFSLWAENRQISFLAFFLIYGVSIGGYLLGKSLTNFAAVLLFLPILLFRPAFEKRRIPIALPAVSYVLLVLGVLSVETVLETGLLGQILKDMGKSLNFSGRTPIWEATKEWIAENPVFGYGAEYFAHYVSNEHPHNELLYILFRRGIVGLISLLPMVALLCKQLNCCRSLYLRNGLLWYVFCILVGGLFEVFDIIPMIAMISLVYYSAAAGEEASFGKN